MNTVTACLVWIGDRLLGPRCPFCGERLRGWRTLLDHCEREHPDAIPGRPA